MEVGRSEKSEEGRVKGKRNQELRNKTKKMSEVRRLKKKKKTEKTYLSFKSKEEKRRTFVHSWLKIHAKILYSSYQIGFKINVNH